LLLAAPAGAASGPQGTYRVTLAARDLVRVGASAREAGWDAGTWTLTLAGPRWALRQAGGRYGNALDRGTVARSGPAAAFTLRSADGFVHNEDVGTLTWRSTPAGLRFAPAVRSRNRDIIQILSARPWTRVR
jgi:hypothetical protein